MDKLTLREIVREYQWDWCDLVSTITEESWKYEQQGWKLLIGEEFPLKHKLLQEDYSVEEFRKVAEKYSGASQELEELAKTLIETKRFELLFVEELEETNPVRRLLDEGEYEFIYLLFEEQEDVRRTVISEFGRNEPLLAAEVGSQYQDWELVREALKYTPINTVINSCPTARANSKWISAQLSAEMLSETSDYLDRAKEAIAKIDPSTLSPEKEEAKMIRQTKNMEYREMLGLISRIRRAVSEEMGIKLPSTVNFSEPGGSYGSIGYDRSDLYHEHDLRVQPET